MDDEEQRLLIFMKNKYKNLMEKNEMQLNDNNFMWNKNNQLHFYSLITNDQYAPIYFFWAKKSNSNKLTILDKRKETDKAVFTTLNDHNKLNFLISHKIISKTILNDSIKKSFSTEMFFENTPKVSFSSYIEKLFNKEFKNSQNYLKNQPDVNIIYEKQIFFESNFHFSNLISGIEDKQFIDELEECIFAYNNAKWYLCASGMGGLIEHLMYLTLKNYSNYYRKHGIRLNSILSNRPTAKDYVRGFKQNPIKIDDRKESFINMLFMARNSISHFNTGRTDKSLCNLMMSGLMDLYNDYYVKSKKYKESL
ncbi:hypothetical protein WR164_01740 [Philodulcilactobacillus myokoensis]|uniref:Uncharacterized protein n=1 Tax=Philodulcilactobacillus myokoensis TaxID=2929573 RepID=A0A9W6AZ58_9LACO|nr:hypothetical protein [Philodulcilactobacillus myokoensis]GLB46195.1 hypothetical protein WR164_01740 [Philodulcilactobacillus myokoensis]